MHGHAMSFTCHAALCVCLLTSACALGEANLADRRSAADRGNGAAAGFVSRQGYVPRPLQPNNCGTPDTFKRCLLAATRPEKPVVMIEELGSEHADSAAPTSSALLDYSRLRIQHVVLPEMRDSTTPRHEIGATVESQDTQ